MRSRLRSRRRAERSLELDWRTIPADETHRHPGLMEEMLARRVDGCTVTGVFTPEECEAAIEALQHEEWTPIFWGELIGIALGMATPDQSDRSRYLDDAEASRAVMCKAFGFDPHDRLADVLAPMASGRSLVAPTEDGRPYNPGQMRRWTPGLGGLRAHVGNEFRRDLADFAMKHLLTVTAVTDHLSYFVVLQEADEGGSLSVYDLLWDQDDASSHGWMGERDDSDFDRRPHLSLTPGPGDLILFGGGWRWHRVEPITGVRPRITYGGFCARSVDGSELHFWA